MSDRLLLQLASAVETHLGVSDADATISRFLLSLYRPGASQDAFARVVEENGGSDFAPQFVAEVYHAIERDTQDKNKATTEGKGFEHLASPTVANITASTMTNPATHRTSTSTRETSTRETSTRESSTRETSTRETSTRESATNNKSLSARQNGNSSIGTTTSMHGSAYPALLLPDRAVPNPTHGPPAPNSTPKPAANPANSADAPTMGAIYKGYVSNIVPYGVFVRLHSPVSLISGLCHVLQMLFDGRTRIRHPSDVVTPNQEVFVKVAGIAPSGRRKISLSMVGVDQLTGLDRADELQQARPEHRGRAEKRARPARRLTSPERWEIRQLIAAGAARASDYPQLYGAVGTDTPDAADPDHEVLVDVELNPHEPKFLQGQVRGARAPDPKLIVRNPEGSMSRAAMSGLRMAQEMKEERARASRDARKHRDDPLAAKAAAHLLAAKDDTANADLAANFAAVSRVQRKRRAAVPLAEQRRALPVYAMRSEIVSSVRANQFVVVVGETGSGKTTQIVQYLYEDAVNVVDGVEKIIGCTQPRRVAAESVAKRVAQEVGCALGQQVGYTVRFDDTTSGATRIKYLTDGMLEREALLDPTMLKYSVVMLDEAHERTIATDVLFALLKQAARANPALRVIVTSATLDLQKFSRYFNDCPVLHVPGRTFPVDVMFSREPEPDYLAAALDCVMQIHVAEAPGDILVFLTGQEEIDTCCEALAARAKTLGRAAPELVVLPVYAALPPDMQARIFEPAPEGARKVVLATNIAETSITIDGIRYVVDPGFVKLNAYDPRLGMDLLIVSPISQAQANQRSGRAGRTAPGKCFRLYTEAAFNSEMLPNTVPEIQRQNLAHTILMLKAMGINDLLRFEFMDPPPAPTMVNALHELYALDALDDAGFLTALGRKMAEFPMEPALAKTLLASVDLECAAEVLSVVAMLSVQNVFYRPKDKQAAADQRKQRFHSVHGDHLTLLNVYRSWELGGRSLTWCKANYIHERSMRRAHEVRKQLVAILGRFRLDIQSCDDTSAIRRAFCSGYFRNLAKRDPHEGIFNTLVDQTPVHLHPLLAVYGKSADYVIYHTLLLTTKEYMHCVSIIDPKWLIQLAPRFFQASDPNNPNEHRKKQKIVPLFNRYADSQDSWRLTAQVEEKKKALGRLNQ